MKWPGIFVLTKREQRAVILIVMALLAATIVKHYRNQESQVPSARSTSADTNATPTATLTEDEPVESGE
jgi:hypothetical protein